jgi:excinuclease UvrABC nuclease subunit
MTTKRFSITKPINNRNLSDVPNNKPGVYRIKNSKNDTLYIGMAKRNRLSDRILEHKGEFKGGTKFQYRVVNKKEEAERLERKEIRKINPPRNKKK